MPSLSAAAAQSLSAGGGGRHERIRVGCRAQRHHIAWSQPAAICSQRLLCNPPEFVLQPRVARPAVVDNRHVVELEDGAQPLPITWSAEPPRSAGSRYDSMQASRQTRDEQRQREESVRLLPPPLQQVRPQSHLPERSEGQRCSARARGCGGLDCPLRGGKAAGWTCAADEASPVAGAPPQLPLVLVERRSAPDHRRALELQVVADEAGVVPRDLQHR